MVPLEHRNENHTQNAACHKVDSALRREGGSGLIFACLAHIKVPFTAEQQLFMERSYSTVSKGF